MNRLTKLPPAFKRFRKVGGVLQFAVFEGAAGGGEEEVLEAMRLAVPHGARFDTERLRALGCRRIGEKAFFGDWYDRSSGKLLKLGSFTTGPGELTNPRLDTLDRVEIMSGASPAPEPGTGGQFAYAFFNPPYSLDAHPSEVQALFEEIRDFILPPLRWSEILDWASPRLPEVSDYFALGMEFWGVFLFSIHVPAVERLTIVAGSTTA